MVTHAGTSPQLGDGKCVCVPIAWRKEFTRVGNVLWPTQYVTGFIQTY